MLATRVALILIASEGASLLTIRLTRPLQRDEIRTTRDIFREQSARIRRLLAPAPSDVVALDPLLGWRYVAGHQDAWNTISAQGLRSSRSYTATPGAGVVRVAAFGDSFVYGSEVPDSAAWPRVIERAFPRVEVLNYGVGGYGVDQAYLRFRAEGAALAPRLVIIGFATDDLRRVDNVYRRFISNREYPLVKPRFAFDARGELVLLPNPLPRPADYARYLRSPATITELGANDDWYRAAIYEDPLYDYSATVRLLTNVWVGLRDRFLWHNRLFRHGAFNPSCTAFQIQMALFVDFVAAVERAGARPLVVIFPDEKTVAQARRGSRAVLATLVERLAERGIDYVDLTRAFVLAVAPPQSAGGLHGWFLPGGHYSAAGNRVVAQALGPEILARATPARYPGTPAPARPGSAP